LKTTTFHAEIAMQASTIYQLTAYPACSLGFYRESTFIEWPTWGLKHPEVILGIFYLDNTVK